MKTIFYAVFVFIFALTAIPTESQAGWKIRGWYSGKRAIQCTMKKVVVLDQKGRPVVKKIRVCR